ncbi:hypothetical protein PL11201_610002 [Planktothrix sp. PCC 11201]|uniref:VWD domain-containing protein n=1 Tax=Planktothrix sp. PCC 11201 TaxID=1729650 RepID=UPI0009166562|nr:VWD domain-containing protein [Planktothrix sp. PCC 11201]SKB14156.1 hypothetical protein PL11201_610002 [Planktothrix sp. PCC 11201]
MKTFNTLEITETSPVQQALQIAKNQLNNFASSADFKTQMQIALGNQRNWETTDLIDFPAIEIRPAAEINNARGAFAAATNTIYLSQELVNENTGNVGAIASVLLEEYGHYLDAQLNAIDSPGDEGELFADLVLGKGLSQSEILALWGEDDSAIVVWGGEGVSIEQAEMTTQKDTLNFFAGGIKDWGEGIFGKEFEHKFIDSQKDGNFDLPAKTEDFGFLKFTREVKSSLDFSIFAKLDTFGDAQFTYPIDLTAQLPKQVDSGETIKITPFSVIKNSSASFDSIATKGFELPNAGVKFELNVGGIQLKDITLASPGKNPKKIDGIDISPGKAELSIDVLNWASSEGNRLLKLLNLGNVQVEKPTIEAGEIKPVEARDTSDVELPDIAAKGKTNNFLNAAFDLDDLALSLIPGYKVAQIEAKLLGIELKGLGFEINLPSSAEEEGRAEQAREKANQAQKRSQEAQQKLQRLQETSGLTLAPQVEQARQEAEIAQQEANTTENSAQLFERMGEVSKKLADAERVRASANGDLFDFKFNAGFGFQQDFTFDPNKVQVMMSVEGQPEQNGVAGKENNEFKFTAPSQGSGVVKVKAKYRLSGEAKNNIGPIGQAYFDYKALQIAVAGQVPIPGDPLGFKGQVSLGPLFQGKLPKDSFATDPFALVGSPPNPNKPNEPDPLFKILRTVSLDGKNDDQNSNQDLEIEVEYQIPYNLPYSISDARADEGENLVFTVSRNEPSNEPVFLVLEYENDTAKAGEDYFPGQRSVTIPAGQVSADITVPTTGDDKPESTETFKVKLKKSDGSSFATNDTVSTIDATGIIIDNDQKPEQPKNGGKTYNDPRIITIDKQYHDFQAAGEFTLIESTTGDLKIQVRQQPINNNPRSNVSDNTAVATVLGGKRIGIYKDQGLLIDGQPTQIANDDALAIGEGRIYREGNTYTVVYPTGDQLVAKVGSRVNVEVYLKDEREGKVKGLLGNFNKNPKDDLAKPDGTVLTSPISPEQLYGEYADSWRVNQAESLFDYQPGENTNTFTLQNYPRQKVKISDLTPADVAKAEELIGDRITDPIIRESTIIDLVLTNFDPEIIEATVNVPSPESSVIIRVDPEAKADFISTFANTPVKINPLTNDIVTTGIPLSLTGYDQTSAKGGTIQLDNNGTPDDKTDDQLTYTPPTNFVGIDTINYTIADDQKTATGTITVTVPAINLNALNGNNGFTVTGAAGNFAGSSLSNIGDFNGDTIDDFIVGGFAADPNNINATGESYVVFGTNQGFPANFDLSTLNGTNGFIIEGFETESFSGGAVSSAGDINGDGLKDLIIGAFSSDSNSLNDSGRTYVILGSKQAFSTRFNLANLNGNNGFVINSNQPLDYSGLAVSSAGDFNNDGLDDLAVAAPAGIDTFLGKVYIVYGRLNSFPPAFNPTDLQWDDGMVINHNNGLAGTTVSNAGDINGDQIDDLIIGAEQGSLEGNPKAGETYVLFGKDGGYQKGFSLSNLDGTNGFTIKGDGYSVSSVSGAGDINADGLKDIIIGVSQSPGNNQTNAGKAYVVFGTQAGFTQQIDLFTLNGNNGFVINGVEPDELLGGSVKGAGDINGDKIDDLIIGASGATANGIKSAGKTYVVFGSQKGFPASLNSSDLNGEKGFFLNGTAENELSGIAVSSAGDINQDSVNDILIGAPGSLFDNTIGKSYVVFGTTTFGNQTLV